MSLPIKGPQEHEDDDEPAQPLRAAHGIQYIRRFFGARFCVSTSHALR